jgi:MFS family permease
MPLQQKKSTQESQHLSDLEKRLEKEENGKALYDFFYRTLVSLAVGLVTFSLLLIVLSINFSPLAGFFFFQNTWLFNLALGILVFGIFCYIATKTLPTDKVESLRREFELKVQMTKNEFDALKAKPSQYTLREQRAELQLMYHQVILMRYYDQNLNQNEMLFNYGVGFVSFGLLLIIITLILLMQNPQLESQERILTIIFGGTSGIGSSFVGAIFINMFRKTTEVTIKFHEKFVETNNLYFSSYLASKITTDAERNNTLKTMVEFLNKK